MHASYNHYKRLLYELSVRNIADSELEDIKRKVAFEMPTYLLWLNRIAESLDFSYSLAKKYPDMNESEKVKFYNALAGAYIKIDQKQCRYYLDKMLALRKNRNVTMKADATIDNIYSGYLFYEGKTDSAIYYLDMAIDKMESADNDLNKYYMFMNYVHICFHLGDSQMAMIYLKKILDNVPSELESFLRSIALIDMASLYLNLGNKEKALQYYKDAAAYSRKIGDLKIEYMAKMHIGELLNKMGFGNEGMKMTIEAYQIKDSLTNQISEDQIYWMSKDFEVYRQQTDRLLDDTRRESIRLSEKNKNLTTIFVAFIIFLFLIGVVFFILYKLKMYKTKSDEISRKLEEHQLQSQQDISQKDNRIMTGMLQGLKKNDALKDIREKLDTLKTAGSDKERNIILSELYDILKDCEIHEDMNNEVRLQFEVSHPHFTERIKEECPQLTDKEIYVCTLLASGMSAKEIARLNNYSIRSIETIVYRLRKKLQLSADVKTQEYLHRFCD